VPRLPILRTGLHAITGLSLYTGLTGGSPMHMCSKLNAAHLVGEVVSAPPMVLEIVLQTADDAVLLLQLPHHVLDMSTQHDSSPHSFWVEVTLGALCAQQVEAGQCPQMADAHATNELMLADCKTNLHSSVEVPVQAGTRHRVVVLQSGLQRPHLPVNHSEPVMQHVERGHVETQNSVCCDRQRAG
jgi:hypothetical protein